MSSTLTAEGLFGKTGGKSADQIKKMLSDGSGLSRHKELCFARVSTLEQFTEK